MKRRSLPLAALAAGLAAIAFAMLPGPASAAPRTLFQARCEDTISKTVAVLTSQQNGYSINTQLSYKALTAMKGSARQNMFVLGLTRTESRVTIRSEGSLLTDPVSGYECIAPKVAVNLSYAPVVIYVGSEFPAGSCGYKEILAHEFRHMQAYMDHLPKVETSVRAALAQRYGGKPFYAPGGTARSALAHELDSGWLPYIKTEMSKVERQQELIDSPAEYARLSKACNGEIQAVLNRTRPRR